MPYDYTYVTCGLSPILTQALQKLGYAWDFVKEMGQTTTICIQNCVRFRKNQIINSLSVGYI